MTPDHLRHGAKKRIGDVFADGPCARTRSRNARVLAKIHLNITFSLIDIKRPASPQAHGFIQQRTDHIDVLALLALGDPSRSFYLDH